MGQPFFSLPSLRQAAIGKRLGSSLALTLLISTFWVNSAVASEQSSHFIAEKHICEKISAPAVPEKKEQTQSYGERFDAAFGKWLVKPLATAMFYDLFFWDNEVDDNVKAAVGGKVLKGKKSSRVFSQWSDQPQLNAQRMPKRDDDGQVLVQGFSMRMRYQTWGSMVMPVAGENLKKGVTVWVGDASCHRTDIATVDEVHADGSVLLTSTAIIYQTENPINRKVPAVVLWLVLGSIFFTFRMGFINVRAFFHAFSVVKGDYDNPEDEGEISHFQALSSALSATVGLGNIAGVAIAVTVGGPGALFWMIVAGALGMSSKFVECTLGQIYRRVNAEGVVMGGPMQYLKTGLSEFADEKLEGGSQAMLKTLGTGLSGIFAIMCIGGSFGGGNMFQGNQTFSLFKERIPAIAEYDWAFGLVLAVLVGLVIIGGIKRIGAAASFLVPTMVGGYLLASLYILISNAGDIPWAIGVIIGEAFNADAGLGGAIGVLITGFQRAAFSNEAGVGSAAIAHSAAATDEPVREGIVALLGPFIDTIVVCTMTGLVIVITRAYQLDNIGDGVLLTSLAFKSVLPWFPWILTVAVALFAFSTMISWSYYGERCATMLFGENASLPYRMIYCIFAFLGPVLTAHNVVDFSDLMILGMAFPNVLGVILLSGKVRERLDDYWTRLKSGKMVKTLK